MDVDPSPSDGYLGHRPEQRMLRLLTTLSLALLLAQVQACKSDECMTDFDCPAGSSCRLGLCSPVVNEADVEAVPDIIGIISKS